MIVREAKDLEEEAIGSSGLRGKALVRADDHVGYVCYEVVVPHAGSITLKTIHPGHNHIYYCFRGGGRASLGNAWSAEVAAHTVVALTPVMVVQLEASANTRLFVTYVEEDGTAERSDVPCVRKLNDILGTDMNVNWGRGFSRRFLSKHHGYNVSVHNTICQPQRESDLEYKYNYEVAYYIRGDVEYIWDGGKSTHRFRQTSAADGNGCVFLMDKHDKHVLRTFDVECETLCVFYPALKGTENHDFSKGGGF